MVHRSRGSLSLAALVIIAHALAFIWHLFVVSKIPPGLPSQQILFVAIAGNGTPVIGLIFLLRRADRLAAVLILVPMAFVFVIGAREHFLNFGPSSVFAVSDPRWAWSFRASAVFLIILEILGCWIGVRLWLMQTKTPSADYPT
jgi:hypothetical protein